MNIARWAAVTILCLAVGATLLLGLCIGKGCTPITVTKYLQPTTQPSTVDITEPDGTKIHASTPGSAPFNYTHHGSALKEQKNERGGFADAGRASGSNVKLEGKAGSFNLNSLMGIGGETDAQAEADVSVTSTILIGIFLIVAGVLVWLWLKMPGLGLALAVAGIAIITIGVVMKSAPWLFVVGFLVCLGLGGFILYTAWRHKTQAGTASAAIQAIQKIKELGPADLSMTFDPKQLDLVQRVIDATEKAIIANLQVINSTPTTSGDAPAATNGLKALLAK